MGTDPGPWLSGRACREFSFATFFQYDSVDRVVLVMDVGFVPAFEAVETLHDFMLGSHDLGCESLAPVFLELSTAKLDVLF